MLLKGPVFRTICTYTYRFILSHPLEWNPEYTEATTVPPDVTSKSEFAVALRSNIAYIRKNLSHINACHTENYYRIKSNFFQGSYTRNLIVEYNSLHPDVNVYPEFRINRIYKTILLSCFQQTKTRTWLHAFTNPMHRDAVATKFPTVASSICKS